MHIHKWSKWQMYSQNMKSVSKYGTHDYIREYQERECSVCGLKKTKEM